MTDRFGMNKTMQIKLDDPKAMPLRAHPYDAGADLKSMVDYALAPGEMKMIDTGVSVKVPKNYVGLVFARSSMGKIRVMLANSVGVIDESYRGNIKVMLVNEGTAYFDIKRYDRIAQFVLLPIELPQLIVYDSEKDGEWDDTERSSGGFGSTGKQ